MFKVNAIISTARKPFDTDVHYVCLEVICLHVILGGKKVWELLRQNASGMPSSAAGMVEGAINHLNNSWNYKWLYNLWLALSRPR